MRYNFTKLKRFFPFLLIFVMVLFLYHPVLFTYFSQDDFFHFKVSLRFTNFIDMFGFYPFDERGIAFYRPIFREVLFNSFYTLFGLNAYPFRILQFTLLFLNTFLGFTLIQKLFQNKKLSFFVAFFYAVCSAQVSPIFYLAGGIQVLGATTFLLSTMILVINYLEKNKNKYLIYSFITFLLGLASHELSFIIPALIGGLFFVHYPFKKAIIKILQILPFFLVLFIYLYLDFARIGFSSSETQYKAVFNIKTIMNSYMWYTGWALGLPEMLVDFVNPGFKLNPSLMRYWGNYYSIIFPSFFLSILLLVVKIFSSLFTPQGWNRRNDGKLVFLVFWYLISLAPVILLPLHKSTQYLETGLVAFCTIIGYIIFSLPPSRWIRTVLIGALFTLSTASILLQRTTYPAAQRGVIAQKLIKQITDKYPTLPKGAIIYIENDPDYPFVASEWGSSSKQAAFILNNEDALQLVYKDPGLKVYYQDLEGLTSDLDKNKLHRIRAVIF